MNITTDDQIALFSYDQQENDAEVVSWDSSQFFPYFFFLNWTICANSQQHLTMLRGLIGRGSVCTGHLAHLTRLFVILFLLNHNPKIQSLLQQGPR